MSSLYDSTRKFQVWEYTVGHKQLLLRSTKDRELDTRIDLFFKDVGAIVLPTTLNGVSIRQAVDREDVELRKKYEAEAFNGRTAYLIWNRNIEGCVIAATFAWHEDRGEYDDPSFFRLRP